MKKVKLTTDKLNELVERYTNLPEEPVGAHLSDEDFVNFCRDELTAKEVDRVNSHLISCEECTIEMEQLMEAAEARREVKETQNSLGANDSLSPVEKLLQRLKRQSSLLWPKVVKSLKTPAPIAAAAFSTGVLFAFLVLPRLEHRSEKNIKRHAVYSFNRIVNVRTVTKGDNSPDIPVIKLEEIEEGILLALTVEEDEISQGIRVYGQKPQPIWEGIPTPNDDGDLFLSILKSALEPGILKIVPINQEEKPFGYIRVE